MQGYQLSHMTAGTVLILFFFGLLAIPLAFLALSHPAIGILEPALYEQSVANGWFLCSIVLPAALVPVIFQLLVDDFIFYSRGWLRW